MTYTIYSYASRKNFDLDKRDDNEDTRHTKEGANAFAQRQQWRGYWVRVYRDGEYLYYLTPEGEIDEP